MGLAVGSALVAQVEASAAPTSIAVGAARPAAPTTKPPAPTAKPLASVAKPAPRPVAAPVIPKWEALPPPGPLPEPTLTGTFVSDDAKLWYASFGEGDPVVLLHGGLGNSNHYGDVVKGLAAKRRVIVLDSRGHGRSTRSAHGISYAQMADDVIALLDHLGIERAAVVGWSDGGATGLDLAIRHPDRLTRLFVLGTNYALDGVKAGGPKGHTFPEYFARCRREYARLAPDPKQLGPFLQELRAMWTSQPAYTDAQIKKIQTPVLVAIGDHDEAIRLDHVQKLARLLPHGKLVVLPGVSHFAMWQDPAAFTAQLTAFLDQKQKQKPQSKPTKPAKPKPPLPKKKPAAKPSITERPAV
jgi:pimeloyl-ACP methyl ester carboxylesterase